MRRAETTLFARVAILADEQLPQAPTVVTR
jgi:hypothetical protein